MGKIKASVIVDRPVEEVWSFVTNLSNTPVFDPACVIEMKQTSVGSLGVGTTLLMRRRPYPHEPTFRVIEYETNRKFTLEYTWPPVKGSKVSFDMETSEGKTKLNLAWDLEYHGLGNLIMPLINRNAKRESVAFAGNIKRALESEVQAN